MLPIFTNLIYSSKTFNENWPDFHWWFYRQFKLSFQVSLTYVNPPLKKPFLSSYRLLFSQYIFYWSWQSGTITQVESAFIEVLDTYGSYKSGLITRIIWLLPINFIHNFLFICGQSTKYSFSINKGFLLVDIKTNILLWLFFPYEFSANLKFHVFERVIKVSARVTSKFGQEHLKVS